MNFDELINRLGIKEYPPGLEEIFYSLGEDDGSLCNVQKIRDIEERYAPLGEYIDEVISGAAEVEKSEELVLWGRLAIKYNKNVSAHEACQFPFPESDGSKGRDTLPLLVILDEIPSMAERYAKRGFSKDEILAHISNIKRSLWIMGLYFGKVMLNKGHYNWLCLYTKAMIFDHKAFNFQPNVWSNNVIYLKNRKSGEIIPMMTDGCFHRCGLPLGTAGAEDTDGAFNADFVETPELYIGHVARDGKAERAISRLLRADWECILRPGDDVINLHIPRDVDLSPEYVTESLREGFELSKKYYPELNPKFIVCFSWLLSTQLPQLCGESSKITFFNTRFLKYPFLDRGTGCLAHVFPGYQNEPVDSYPENTSLQRGIKKIMLDGGYLVAGAGIITEL